MPVIDTLSADLKEALKARNEIKLSTLRLIKASLKNKEIENMSVLTHDEIVAVLSTMAKQRRESIEQYTAAGRLELASREEQELSIIQSYLPKQLAPEELDAVIRTVILESGATSTNDMGKVMKALVPKVKGIADGKLVNQRVRDLLQ
ncbi:MAG TPA: GatB/YqeY domain-containing protein [Dissulfurispiraceae bacterium]|nr:GatB/YqeY domain-containing protein [Dissulfurispiraceae bacterium]